MAKPNYFQIMTLMLQAATEIQEVQTLHDEPRFNALRDDFVGLLNTAGTFFAKDKLAAAIVKAGASGIQTLTYQDIVNSQPQPVTNADVPPATSTTPSSTLPGA